MGAQRGKMGPMRGFVGAGWLVGRLRRLRFQYRLRRLRSLPLSERLCRGAM